MPKLSRWRRYSAYSTGNRRPPIFLRKRIKQAELLFRQCDILANVADAERFIEFLACLPCAQIRAAPDPRPCKVNSLCAAVFRKPPALFFCLLHTVLCERYEVIRKSLFVIFACVCYRLCVTYQKNVYPMYPPVF